MRRTLAVSVLCLAFTSVAAAEGPLPASDRGAQVIVTDPNAGQPQPQPPYNQPQPQPQPYPQYNQQPQPQPYGQPQVYPQYGEQAQPVQVVQQPRPRPQEPAGVFYALELGVPIWMADLKDLLKPGFGFGARFGYSSTLGLGIEMDFGYTWNGIESTAGSGTFTSFSFGLGLRYQRTIGAISPFAHVGPRFQWWNYCASDWGGYGYCGAYSSFTPGFYAGGGIGFPLQQGRMRIELGLDVVGMGKGSDVFPNFEYGIQPFFPFVRFR